MSISKEKAIEQLTALIKQVDVLKNHTAFSEQHTRWLMNVYAITKEIFGTQSAIVRNMANLPWQKRGSFIVDPMIHGTLDYNEVVKKLNHEAYLEQLNTAKGILESGIDQINTLGIEAVRQLKDTPEESSEIIKILDLAETRLRKIIREAPQSEKDVQDKFEELLIANGITYLREQEKIVYSSKTYHPDFSFPRLNTVLEIKYCGKANREKDIISEINDDIVAYRKRYANIIFVVYDMGHIRDSDRFKDDIETNGAIVVRVVKH